VIFCDWILPIFGSWIARKDTAGQGFKTPQLVRVEYCGLFMVVD